MRVLVTGGAGFIGSHIVDALLDSGHECAVIDDLSSGTRANVAKGVPLFQIDIRNADDVSKAFADFAPDAVSHQAAQMSVSRSVREPAFDAEVNALGLLNVLSAAQAVGVSQFVFASSGGVLYGEVTEPADEEHPADPISPYGITKWVGERYLQFYNREHDMRCTALRYANVYGPRQNPHGEAGVVAIFSKKLLAGEAPTINGDGKYVRDYVYGPDVAQANALALERTTGPGFAAYNIGTGVATDVNQLELALREHIQQMLKAGRSKLEVPTPQYGPARAGDLRSSIVSAAKAERELGWKPTVALDDGLRQTAEWFAAQ